MSSIDELEKAIEEEERMTREFYARMQKTYNRRDGLKK